MLDNTTPPMRITLLNHASGESLDYRNLDILSIDDSVPHYLLHSAPVPPKVDRVGREDRQHGPSKLALHAVDTRRNSDH